MTLQKQNILTLSLLGILLPTLAYVFTATASNSNIAVAIALTQTAVAQQPAKVINPLVTPIAATLSKAEAKVERVSTSPDALASRFEFSGVSFPYQDDLVNNVTTQKTQAFANYDNLVKKDDFIVAGLPDFTEMILDTGTRPGRLAIQPIKTETGQYYAEYQPANLEIFETLSHDLRHQAGRIANPIQLEYLQFASGQGRRHIRLMDAADSTSGQAKFYFYYTFEGLTADGRYQVWFNYPVFTFIGSPQISGSSPELSQSLLIEQMNSLTADDFIPNLAKLDNWIQQVQVEPVDTFNYTRDPNPVVSAFKP